MREVSFFADLMMDISESITGSALIEPVPNSKIGNMKNKLLNRIVEAKVLRYLKNKDNIFLSRKND